MLIYSDSQWPPRRIHDSSDLPRDEFAETFSDGRELEAAHAASEMDDYLETNRAKTSRSNWAALLSALLVLAIAAFVAVVKQ